MRRPGVQQVLHPNEQSSGNDLSVQKIHGKEGWFDIPSSSQDPKKVVFLRHPRPISWTETVLGERRARTWERSWSKADECATESLPKKIKNVEERVGLSDWAKECGALALSRLERWWGDEDESHRDCFQPIYEWECRQGTFWEKNEQLLRTSLICPERDLQEKCSRISKPERDTKILLQENLFMIERNRESYAGT